MCIFVASLSSSWNAFSLTCFFEDSSWETLFNMQWSTFFKESDWVWKGSGIRVVFHTSYKLTSAASSWLLWDSKPFSWFYHLTTSAALIPRASFEKPPNQHWGSITYNLSFVLMEPSVWLVKFESLGNMRTIPTTINFFSIPFVLLGLIVRYLERMYNGRSETLFSFAKNVNWKKNR